MDKQMVHPGDQASRGPQKLGDTRTHKDRRPWSGGLSDEEMDRPGGILLAMLFACANERGHRIEEMATKLGVMKGYLHQLRIGTQKTPHISEQFADACALYLGVPRMTVLLASGKLRPTDVFEDKHEMLRALPHALKYIHGDPEVGPLMPNDVFRAKTELQIFIVTLYEMARSRKLLPGRHTPAEVAREIQGYAEDHERLRRKVEADQRNKAKRQTRED